MHTRSITRSIALVLFSLPAITLLGASPTPNVAPVHVWLQFTGNYHPNSRDIFNAFESTAASSPVVPMRLPEPGTDKVNAGPAIYPLEFRSIDGRNNATKDLGQAGTVHLRNTTVGYADGTGSPAGPDRASARVISNTVCAETPPILNTDSVSNFIWVWGNFVDHDMSLLKVASPPEEFDIAVPTGDPTFDPKSVGGRLLHFQRSNSTTVNGIRQQINANTAFIDASMVYGSDNFRAKAVRANDGLGHLLTSTGNFLPFNVNGLPNQPERTTLPASFFLAGDVRANENTPLLIMQTLFVREHNFWADSFAGQGLSDDDVYQRARAIVCAEIQEITYRDFIPVLLGPNALTTYAGYNETVDPRVSIIFSTAGFRLGHTMLPATLRLLNKRNVATAVDVLGQTIFQPNLITASGLEPWLRGLSQDLAEANDPYIIDAIRSFLVGGVGPAGFDLIALDIQRGRDQGLPSYNQVRIDFGLPPVADFTGVTSDTVLQGKLLAAFPNGPDDADVMVCAMAEPHVNGGQVGETFAAMLKDQFQRSRDGDRFWYESYLDAPTLATVQLQTLSGIIKRNCPSIGAEMQADVFLVPAPR